MVRAWLKRGLLVSCLLCCVGQELFSQNSNIRPFRLRQATRTSFDISFGVVSPQGRAGLREFWLSGPGGSAKFNVHLNPAFAVGAGADVALLYFDEGAFGRRWPGTRVDKKNLVLGNLYFDATYSFLAGNRTRPYLSAQVGAQFTTAALYREVIAGVRHTYYDVGGKPRLAVGLTSGAIISLTYNVGILIELKGTFIHNDPSVNFLVHGRAGLQFKL